MTITLLYIVSKTIRIFIIIIFFWFSQRLFRFVVKNFWKGIIKKSSAILTSRQQRLKTLVSLILTTGTIIINFIALLLIFSELGINILPLLTGVGILGLGLGLGAKTLVADIIAGFFILTENQFNVGDEVDLGSGWKGRVRKITIRTTILKDKKERTYIIPNSSIKAVIKYPRPN